MKRHDADAKEFNPKTAKTRITQERLEIKKRRFLERADKTARAEILAHEEFGGIVKDEGEDTQSITQQEICENVDIASATKHFELTLENFGPYRFNYTRNGRYIVMGGHKGHLASFDWMTKSLKHETNVMESIKDVQFLHTEKIFAVAQKRWLRIYDDQGTELHCIKAFFDVQRLEFLHRHMLLVGGSDDSFIHYLDTCIGKIVTEYPTKQGRINVMTQNPANAIILTGSPKGVVAMWSPNAKEPLVELLTHTSAVLGVTVDKDGKIWDLRMYKELHSYATPILFNHITFSQRGYLAAAAGAQVQIFNDATTGELKAPYMVHRCPSLIHDLQFCPYEDVLGIGTQTGFTSILVPGLLFFYVLNFLGAGDPNIGSENPFETKSQRREREVKMLLDKIQPELISLDPSAINRVNKENSKKKK